MCHVLIFTSHHLLLLLLLVHFWVSQILSAFRKHLILSRCIFDKVALIEESGPIKGVSELALELLTVEHIPDLVRHLPVRLVNVLPLCEGERTRLDVLHLQVLNVLDKLELVGG